MFNPKIKIEGNNDYELTLHKIRMQCELEALKRLRKVSLRSETTNVHAVFIGEQLDKTEEHVRELEVAFEKLSSEANELVTLLNEKAVPVDLDETALLGYTVTIDEGKYCFVKQLYFDQLLEKQAYAFVEVTSEEQRYNLWGYGVGYSQELQDLHMERKASWTEQLALFARLQSEEQVAAHEDYCERFIFKVYGVESLDELVELEVADQHVFKKHPFGNPKPYLRKLQETARFHLLKWRLPEGLGIGFNEEVLALMKCENVLVEKDYYVELLGETRAAKIFEQQEEKKAAIMAELEMSQKKLDQYMAYWV